MYSIVQDIKAELRANMNGVASAIMRTAGMTADYRVNFGVELPRIMYIAKNEIDMMLPADRPAGEAKAELAQMLWNESVRECRILATWLYPPERMSHDLADLWADGIRTAELAQIAALNLFSKIPEASTLAFRWIAAEAEMKQICGFYTVCHILRNRRLSDRSADELRDQVAAAMLSDNSQLRTAAEKVGREMEDSAF